jgi:hypothetical protein
MNATTVRLNPDKSTMVKYKISAGLREANREAQETRAFHNLLACLAKERSYTFNSIIFRHKEDEKEAKQTVREGSKDLKPMSLFEKKLIKPNKSMNNLKNKMPPIRSRNQESTKDVNKAALRTMSVNLNVNVSLNYTQNGNTFNINNYTRRAPFNYISLMETRHKNYKVNLPVTNKSTTLIDKKIISLYKNKLK